MPKRTHEDLCTRFMILIGLCNKAMPLHHRGGGGGQGLLSFYVPGKGGTRTSIRQRYSYGRFFFFILDFFIQFFFFQFLFHSSFSFLLFFYLAFSFSILSTFSLIIFHSAFFQFFIFL